MPPADCVIVGGGVPAMVSALALADGGRSVIVLDGGHPSASAAAAGVLSPLPPWRCGEVVADLAAAGAAMYPGLLAALDDDCGRRRCGMLVLPPHDDAALRRWRAKNAGEAETVAAGDWCAALRAGGEALLLPSAAVLSPALLLAALRRKLGARRRIGKAAALRARGGRVAGVELSGGEVIAAAEVVLSAGAWSGGLCPPPAPAISPRRGQMILYAPRAPLLPGVVLSEERDLYLLQRADGALLAGSTMEDAGFDESVTDAGRRLLRAGAASLLPCLADELPQRAWAGLRPMPADGAPYIGAHARVAGLFLNTGHGRYGITMAPAAAKKLTAIMDAAAP